LQKFNQSENKFITDPLYIIQHIHSVIHHVWPTCFDAEMPSAGSHYHKDIYTNCQSSFCSSLREWLNY